MNVGPPPRARALDRLARRLEHGEHVAAVDADPRDPVAGRLVDERVRVRLRRQRRRDRPLVVVAEQHQRRLHHRGEVRALVERALARRAVAEVDDRDGRLALQLLSPREPGGVRHVRPDRHADRRDVVARPGSTSRPDGRATSSGSSTRGSRAAARSRLRGSSGRSSPRARARAPTRPASPRGSRTSRTSRSGPAGGRRASARRTSAAAPSSGRGRAAPALPALRPRGPRR